MIRNVLNRHSSGYINFVNTVTCAHHSTSQVKQPHVCIVGSGPAGFGVAQTLLKNHDHVQVDMFEKLPIPFGLIRYGVSPDHQDVKNAINGYSQTAESERFKFYGNVNVGQDVSLTELLTAYHAVVLCYGAQEEAKLDIPGRSFRNVFSSNQFVGWYNGNPSFQNLDINLHGRTAVIIGVGNVALDCARMLLKPTEQLKDTDITTGAFEALLKSNIKEVHLIGRRGPMQMACTRKELAEISELDCVKTFIDANCFPESVERALKTKDLTRRKQKRLIAYLQKVSHIFDGQSATDHKRLHIRLLRSPIELLSNNSSHQVSGVKLRKRVMKGEDAFDAEFLDTNTLEDLACDLVISSIGYQNERLSPDIPFKNGQILSENGSVANTKDLYACGWCRHGAKGVLADTSNDSLVTGASLLANLNDLLNDKSCEGSTPILSMMSQKGKQVTTWKDWKAIDALETEHGEKLGKVREKLVSCEEMLNVLER